MIHASFNRLVIPCQINKWLLPHHPRIGMLYTKGKYLEKGHISEKTSFEVCFNIKQLVNYNMVWWKVG